MTHAEVGGILAEQWKLPPILVTTIGASHDPSTVTDRTLKAISLLVHLAGLCADVFVDAQAANAIVQVRASCASAFKLSEADCDKLLEEISVKTKEVVSLFEIKIGVASNFEAILEKANEALVELTLQSQMQASKLQQQNQVLQQRATIDALTGLNNRAVFDESLKQHFAASRTAASPLTLLMIDVDKFKAINDHWGHQIGDLVLAGLGKAPQKRRPTPGFGRTLWRRGDGPAVPANPARRRRRVAETIRLAIAKQTHRLRNPIRPRDSFDRCRHIGAAQPDDRPLAPAQSRRHGRLRRQAFRPQLRQNLLPERRGVTQPHKPRDRHPAGLRPPNNPPSPPPPGAYPPRPSTPRVVKSFTPRSSNTGSFWAFFAVTCCKYKPCVSSTINAGRTSGSVTLISTLVNSSPRTCRIENPYAGDPPNREGSGYAFTSSHGSRLVHDPFPPPG